ncbi:helix-turn-helix domain-containing protein [Galbibacter mesophilus]|uniref:helix-turn-helix domain-containing protein n=1 Tax=Galbibacter mesophilus TaxID=379069 RepID=UPI00191D4921|nr:AraC family transcriptional regulator [Galbibacter mesophilus]MCM5662755.1 AraC family transcriptional regulator [Galbibacter mesophilus]
MDLNYNIISFVDALGVIQGLILGSLLLAVHQDNRKSTLFLGLFILAYSLELLPTILEDVKLIDCYPRLTYLPFDFNWLLFPLFYKYVRRISVLSEKVNYIYLYPGILSFVFQVIVFCFPLSVQTAIYESITYLIFSLFGIIYSYWIGIKTVRWINSHINEVRNQFSKTEKRELKWAKMFVIVGLLFITCSVVFVIFADSFWVHLSFSLINVALLYWISLRGILQKNVSSLFGNSTFSNEIPLAPEVVGEVSDAVSNTGSEGILEENEFNKQKQLVEKVTTAVIQNELFKKEDLTIIEISKEVNEHPRTISAAINKVQQSNFNSFINSFRIEEAKKILISPRAENLSIEGVGNEVGFHSKSAFYAAFKKIVGNTPAQYQKQNS